MGIETWAAIGIVCGAILALLAVLGAVVKGLHMLWRKDQRLTDLLVEVRAANRKLDVANNRLDLANERLDATNARLDAVELALAWRTPPPAGTVPRQQPNTGTPPPRRR